jgi:hypothetical protein
MKEWIWSGKPWQAFKNFAIVFSFIANIFFIILLIAGVTWIIPALKEIAEPMVSGVNDSFTEINEAHIVRSIHVEDTIPINFDLPVSTTTEVTIIEPVPMAVPTNFVLPGDGGTINGTVFFELPTGTVLPVQLDIMVPVRQSVPVELSVEVDIPIDETELDEPFDKLRSIFGPLGTVLYGLPEDNREVYRRAIFGSVESTGDNPG